MYMRSAYVYFVQCETLYKLGARSERYARVTVYQTNTALQNRKMSNACHATSAATKPRLTTTELRTICEEVVKYDWTRIPYLTNEMVFVVCSCQIATDK